MTAQKAFTLIELLVVISIISILSVVGFVAFQNVSVKAKDTKIKADLNAIKKAYEANYDPSLNGGQGGYKPLSPSNFAGNQIPVQPNNSPYPCAIGPGCSIDNTNGYKISATLSDGSTTSVTSNQGTLASSGSLNSCDVLGTLSSVVVPLFRREAARRATAPFFERFVTTVPLSGFPPVTTKFNSSFNFIRAL